VKSRHALVVLLVVTLASAAFLSAQDAAAPQNASIRQQDMKADVYFLADDLTRGRLVGTPEYALAAEFVKSRFERLGLTPVGPGNSYFHGFNLMVATLGTENSLEVDEGANKRRALVGQDFYPHRFSASGSVRGGLVFAGFGITAPALSWNDYASESNSVAGKIVLILDH
jgi:hypothetical protein